MPSLAITLVLSTLMSRKSTVSHKMGFFNKINTSKTKTINAGKASKQNADTCLVTGDTLWQVEDMHQLHN